jgi:hypothetical protein
MPSSENKQTTTIEGKVKRRSSRHGFAIGSFMKKAKEILFQQ